MTIWESCHLESDFIFFNHLNWHLFNTVYDTFNINVKSIWNTVLLKWKKKQNQLFKLNLYIGLFTQKIEIWIYTVSYRLILLDNLISWLKIKNWFRNWCFWPTLVSTYEICISKNKFFGKISFSVGFIIFILRKNNFLGANS